MFDAMKSGDLEVKFIPKDDREARVMFKNKTKRPLSVRLPEAFAARWAGRRNAVDLWKLRLVPIWDHASILP